MKVQIDSVFRGLGATLKEVMNLPAEPTSVALTMDQLRIEAELKVLGVGLKTIHVTANVDSREGQLRLTDFKVDGAGLNDIAAGYVRDAIAKVDVRKDPFRVTGESDGNTLVVRWA